MVIVAPDFIFCVAIAGGLGLLLLSSGLSCAAALFTEAKLAAKSASVNIFFILK